MKLSKFRIVWLTTLLLSSHVLAQNNFDYQLKAQLIAEDTYLFKGKKEDFSKQNGGHIVNTAFIVTKQGVIVIDTGPSRKFAEQQLKVIQSITTKPIIRIYNTHHHPDHFLGNQVYDSNLIYALPDTLTAIQSEGEMFLTNMYRLIGDWARDTRVSLPTKTVIPGIEQIGQHKLEMIALNGHTSGDLVIIDHSTGVLFAGDLIFNNRAATTPHASAESWQKALKQLAGLPFKLIVPGHGEIANDSKPIKQTVDYLQWLVATLLDAAQSGADMMEVMNVDIPPRFDQINLVRVELGRSVIHLFPAMEEAALMPATVDK